MSVSDPKPPLSSSSMAAADSDTSAAQPAAVSRKPAGVPNGGLRAWLQVVGVFFIYFNTWGLISCFGSFQAYYETSLLTQHSTFAISTIGSLQSFLLMFLGFPMGPVYDSGYWRSMLVVGSLLIVVGTVLQSLCHELWQLILAQGVVVGAGCGCLTVLSVTTTARWFSTRLPVANGIVAAGSGVGGTAMPLMIRALLPQIGFRWTVLCLALVVAVTLALTNVVLCEPPPIAAPVTTSDPAAAPAPVKPRRRPLVDRDSLTDWPYVTFVFSCFTLFLGFYGPYFFAPGFAIATGAASTQMALWIVPVMNLASIPGRILPMFFAARLGPHNVAIAVSVACAATAFGFLGAAGSLGAVMAVSAVYSFLVGTFFAIQPTVYINLTRDMRIMGTRFGMAFCVMSFGLLLGSPSAGALRVYGYSATWGWVGGAVTLGAALVALSRFLYITREKAG